MMTALHLCPPLIIGSRLMPAVRFDGFTVSLDPGDATVYIDFDDGTETIVDRTFRFGGGVAGDTPDTLMRKAMAAVLGFIAAYGEAMEYVTRNPESNPENAHLFPARFAELAIQQHDEVSMAEWDLEHEEDE